ncbi:LapA family protein [Paracoccus sp. TK19116]|uniref:LapA family protein n=1 Tax=Paracoccus albicereus TaxID=2922394 RepID=A0ABT1MRJ2_9RHOB|nr:LapA family protein [Paracoccus albicereus]MCQ0970764.1 LapA family protein [Paracoccus albicereus]
MRFIRLLFLALLAIVLIALALANRQIVTLSAFPANFGQYLGGTWSVSLPLFLVIFLAMAFGVLVGFIWEWLREAHLRRESRQRAAEVSRLEQEVGHLRTNHVGPRDEVLAIVDGPTARASSSPKPRPIASPAPAPGTTLPASR